MLNKTAGTHSVIDVVVSSSPAIDQVIWYFILNALYSIAIAFILIQLFHPSIVKRKMPFFFLLATIGIFIPLLGGIIAIIAIFLLKKYGKDFKPIEISMYPEVEYSRKRPVKIVAYGTGWAEIRLHSSRYNQSERQQALLSVSRGLPRDANLIYNQLVSDDTEELRVCAFSMLENQQDYLHSQINSLLKKYIEEGDAYRQAFIAKQIALLYWELVYRHLSDEEFRTLLLERSYFYSHKALEILVEDTTLWILLSRIHIERGEIEKGIQNLLIADGCGAPKSKVLPYMAEIAYKNNDYSAVREYLNADSSLAYIFKIHNIIAFWCKS